jgi:hypothetical protein
MSNSLNYRGDCTDFVAGQVFGPDMYGAYYNPTGAIYDAEWDQTTIYFVSGSMQTCIDRSVAADPAVAPECLRPGPPTR